MKYRKGPANFDLEPDYCEHVAAMTAEDLNGKGEIAEELAYRDQQIERLTERGRKLEDRWGEADAKRLKRDAEIERLTAENNKLGTDLRDTTLVLEAHRQTNKLLRDVYDAAKATVAAWDDGKWPKKRPLDKAIAAYEDKMGKSQSCEWFDDDDGWHSGCGFSWEFIYDGPKENSLKFCMHCGKPVVIAAIEDKT